MGIFDSLSHAANTVGGALQQGATTVGNTAQQGAQQVQQGFNNITHPPTAARGPPGQQRIKGFKFNNKSGDVLWPSVQYQDSSGRNQGWRGTDGDKYKALLGRKFIRNCFSNCYICQSWDSLGWVFNASVGTNYCAQKVNGLLLTTIPAPELLMANTSPSAS